VGILHVQNDALCLVASANLDVFSAPQAVPGLDQVVTPIPQSPMMDNRRPSEGKAGPPRQITIYYHTLCTVCSTVQCTDRVVGLIIIYDSRVQHDRFTIQANRQAMRHPQHLHLHHPHPHLHRPSLRPQ
jgi:hypothetical protein